LSTSAGIIHRDVGLATFRPCFTAKIIRSTIQPPASTSMRTVYPFLPCLLLLRYPTTTAFPVNISPQSRKGSTKLYDIHGWRDAGEQEVCILPFSLAEALLQGETKQLRLYEKRFIKLFDDCMTSNSGGGNGGGGVVAMGLIASKRNGILMHPPLCLVEAYNRSMEGSGMGIFVTIRAVGRVELANLTQEAPYIKATCIEIFDDHATANLSQANLVASDIEHAMIQLSSLENQLKAYEKDKKSFMAAELVRKDGCTWFRSIPWSNTPSS
jgi:Lon protease-like protein